MQQYPSRSVGSVIVVEAQGIQSSSQEAYYRRNVFCPHGEKLKEALDPHHLGSQPTPLILAFYAEFEVAEGLDICGTLPARICQDLNQ